MTTAAIRLLLASADEATSTGQHDLSRELMAAVEQLRGAPAAADSTLKKVIKGLADVIPSEGEMLDDALTKLGESTEARRALERLLDRYRVLAQAADAMRKFLPDEYGSGLGATVDYDAARAAVREIEDGK